MTTGPFLYDEGPAPLHTGTPRRRNGLLLAIFGGTAVVAVLMVLALFLLNGSAEEQAEESAGVFLAALQQGDTETAHQLLCPDERAQLSPDDVAAAYPFGEGAEVVGTDEAERDGESVQHVRVQADDGSSATLVVVRADGPRICGTTTN